MHRFEYKIVRVRHDEILRNASDRLRTARRPRWW
jgi:hypothetical protein